MLTITRTAAEAASTVRNWHHGDVLGTLSMTEAYALAALFEQLHENEAAQHIIREVWTGEPADSRDPLTAQRRLTHHPARRRRRRTLPLRPANHVRGPGRRHRLPSRTRVRRLRSL
jgi:hypothetical protein